MPQDPPQKASSAFSETTALWLGLTAAPVVYAFIAFTQRPGEPALTLPDFRNPAELALTLVAAAAALAGLFLPSRLAAHLRGGLSGTGPAADARRAGAEKLVMLVGGALFEAASVAGFVMVYLGAPASTSLPFLALSLALLFSHFPTRERLSKPFER